MQDETNREKIEVWVNSQTKNDLKHWSKKAGYTMAEAVRRAIEEKVVELKTKLGATHG